ncbi:hypothetical protein ES703_116045 [subsurface metagenome]
MTISKQCELLAGDYLFLRDKLMGLQNDITKLTVETKSKEQIQSLADSFILTFLGPPASDILYPNIPKMTLGRVEQGMRDAIKEPVNHIPLALNASIAEFQNEMWQKVVGCECQKR